MRGQFWCWRVDGGNTLSIQRAEPAILAPSHFLNRCLSTERATTTFAQRPAGEINQVAFAVLRLDQTGMARALEFRIRPVPRAHDVSVGMQFVRAGEVARACHRDGMIPVGAAFRS